MGEECFFSYCREDNFIKIIFWFFLFIFFEILKFFKKFNLGEICEMCYFLIKKGEFLRVY